MTTTPKAAPSVCHCGSGKLPGIMRAGSGWCCGVCLNDRARCAGPVVLTRIKRITSHVGVSRFYAACDGGADGVDIIGSIPRQIAQPYRFGPTHPVYCYQGRPVIVCETAHKVYDVFLVQGPIGLAEA